MATPDKIEQMTAVAEEFESILQEQDWNAGYRYRPIYGGVIRSLLLKVEVPIVGYTDSDPHGLISPRTVADYEADVVYLHDRGVVRSISKRGEVGSWFGSIKLSQYSEAKLQDKQLKRVESDRVYDLDVRHYDSEGRSSFAYERFILNFRNNSMLKVIRGAEVVEIEDIDQASEEMNKYIDQLR